LTIALHQNMPADKSIQAVIDLHREIWNECIKKDQNPTKIYDRALIEAGFEPCDLLVEISKSAPAIVVRVSEKLNKGRVEIEIEEGWPW
jgi:hypothetical protein